MLCKNSISKTTSKTVSIEKNTKNLTSGRKGKENSYREDIEMKITEIRVWLNS